MEERTYEIGRLSYSRPIRYECHDSDARIGRLTRLGLTGLASGLCNAEGIVREVGVTVSGSPLTLLERTIWDAYLPLETEFEDYQGEMPDDDAVIDAIDQAFLSGVFKELKLFEGEDEAAVFGYVGNNLYLVARWAAFSVNIREFADIVSLVERETEEEMNALQQKGSRWKIRNWEFPLTVAIIFVVGAAMWQFLDWASVVGFSSGAILLASMMERYFHAPLRRHMDQNTTAAYDRTSKRLVACQALSHP